MQYEMFYEKSHTNYFSTAKSFRNIDNYLRRKIEDQVNLKNLT